MGSCARWSVDAEVANLGRRSSEGEVHRGFREWYPKGQLVSIALFTSHYLSAFIQDRNEGQSNNQQ